MKKFKTAAAVVAAMLIFVGVASAQSPGAVGTNLSIWLKSNSGPEKSVGTPAANGDNITRWLDASGNGFHYISVAGPTLFDNAFNFNPGVQILSGGFDAPAGSELGNDWTVITVSKKLASDQDGRVFDGHISNFLWSHWGTYTNSIYINGNPTEYSSGIATQTGIQNLHLHSFTRTSASGALEARADGTSLKTFGSSNSGSGVRIDINQGNFAAGEDSDSQVGEMIAYARALSATELKRVESYLAVKYGLTISSNYVTSANTTIWDATANAGFGHDIAGIGRDDNSALDQRKSKSVNTGSWITIDKGTAFGTDLSYIVWGDDNGIGESSNVASPYSTRSARVWKTGVSGTPGVASFSIDLITAGFPNTGNTGDYALLLDTDTDFSSGSTVHTTGVSILGNTLTFTNVPFTNNGFFTIVANVMGPGGVAPNLATWLKSDGNVWKAGNVQASTGDAITSWRDMSGQGHHYTAVAGPTFQGTALNFNPSVEILSGGFDAPAGSELGNEWTTFTISRKLASDPDGRLFDGHISNYLWGWWGTFTNAIHLNGNPSNVNSGIATSAGLTNLHLHTYKRAVSGSLEARVEGTSLNTFTGANSANGVRIDINQGAFAGGEDSDSRTGEMIIYSSALSTTDVNKVESYLGIKYGITLTHDYVASDATTIWNVAANSGFNNDVTGIGRDDDGTLNQQKSTTINSLLDITIDKGGAFGTDKSYLLWGNNAGTGLSQNIPSPYKIRTGKVWKTAVIGTPGTVSFSVNIANVGLPNTGSAADYALLIDTDNDFSSGATVHTTGASLVGGILTFTGVPLSNNNFIAVAVQNLVFPGGVTGLVFWVKGDVGVTGTTDVSQWTDQSGFGNNAVQATVANQPGLVTTDLNFHSSINFSGSTDIFNMSNPPADLNSTVFTVAVPNVNSNWRTMFRGSAGHHTLIVESGGIRLGFYDTDGAGFLPSGFNWLQNEPAVVGLEMRAGDVNFRKNGAQGTSITSINLTPKKPDFFGNYQGNGQQFGRISETIIYNAATQLTSAEKEKIESYLAVKYGITLTHNYQATDGTVTWNTTTNAAFTNNVAGIGRDDNTALDQRKSISVNTGAGLTIDKGAAFGTDKTFMVWGNDAGAATSYNIPTGYTLRGARVWKVALTGTPGTVTVSIDLTTISVPNTGNATDYALLKDADSDFSTGSTAITSGASIVGNILSFANVSFSNNDTFAFAVKNFPLPGGVAGGVFWVKGETGIVGTTDVSQWTDQSGFNNNAAQATVANQPTPVTNSINFRRVVNFDNANDFFTLASPPANANSTVFTVAAPMGGTNWRTMFRGQSNDHPIIIQQSGGTALGYYDADINNIIPSGFNWSPNEVALVSLEMRTGDVNFRKNGTQGSSITSINLNVAGLNLFAFGNYQVGGQAFGRIAETVVYNTTSAITTADKEKIETYLGVKYGITLTHNYVASDATVVWNSTSNSTYNNNITGVGRDDNSGLNQTKSLSVHSNASVTVETSGAIGTNNSFLLFGDDASTGSSTNVPPGFLVRTAKVWQAAVTGTPGTVSVTFNLSALGLPSTGSASDFAVLIDNDTDFSSGATAFTTGATLVGAALTFTNLSLANNNFFTLVASNLIQPGGLQGGVFWVKADNGVTGTTDVSSWADQTSNGRDATQATVSLQPTLTTNNINAHAVVDFNVNTDVLLITNPPSILNTTAFVVGAPRNNSNYRTFLRSNGPGDHQMLLENISTNIGYYDQGVGFLSSGLTWAQNEIAIVALEARAGNVNYRKNGSQGSSITSIDLTGMAHAYLGNYAGGSQAAGRIAETIIFQTSSALTATDKQKVESYLAVKFGITLTHDYITTSGTIVWNTTTNATYNNEVGGIGRDDATGLDQRKSISINTGAVVTMDNGGAFSANQSYLIWGNNTGVMNSAGVTDVPATLFSRVARVWKVAKAGTVGGVSVQFNLSGVPGSKSASDLRILIDRNNNGAFNDETGGGGGIIAGATDLGGGNFQFTGVAFNDGELFTIGSASSATPLPITLTPFTAEVTNAGIKIDWTTQQEINNDFFTIEKSSDGMEFFEAARVAGAGNSETPLDYNFLDASPLPGRSYYRLKQTDFDGKITLSKIVSVMYNDVPVLYPNPATKEISIDVDSGDNIAAEITNSLGQKLFIKQSNSSGRVSWSVESLPRGVYYMTILRNDSITTQKLVLID